VIAADNLGMHLEQEHRFSSAKSMVYSFVWISCTIYRRQTSSKVRRYFCCWLWRRRFRHAIFGPTSQLSRHGGGLHTYLAKVFYKRRSDFNPLWNQVLVAGLDGEGKPFLASADLLGTTFSSPSLATGFGAHLAQPLLRKVVPDEEAAAKLSLDEAVAAVKESMKVLFYRDARSLDKYSIAVITKQGIDLKEDEKLENQSWAL
jgi:hypothetical protein